MATATKTWFITGCTSGFGAEFVRQLRAGGHNVIATGRNAEVKLASLKDTGATIMELDVTEPFVNIQAKLQQAWDIYPGGIDVVVNNAGFVMAGMVEDLTPEDLDRSFKVNFYGPLNITRAILPNLRAKGEGTLVFISSLNGWVCGPRGAAYCSSKFALEAMVESLSKELAEVAPKIKLFMPEPGMFRTPVLSKIDQIEPKSSDYVELHKKVETALKNADGNQPGDPVKGVQFMIEMISGVGIAEGRDVPLRVPLGADAFSAIKQKCKATLDVIEQWEDIGKLTDL